MLPTLEIAEDLLNEALQCNPGPWGNHSRVTAHCAKSIAARCENMDENKAYILGLLHDIGRKFGTRHLGHVSDGYSYMESLGYDEVAQICLTHSFHNQSTDEYIGKFDTSEAETALINRSLKNVQMTDYDRLIQLCDALAGSEGVLDIEERMLDVKKRYGCYPQSKWDSNIYLKKYFENKANGNIYEIVKKDTYRPH
ncbi:MAG: HD domain-containing protein [Clostridia bacterium]|nr:HD domain-containing protein [Clostridia bacterium]NCC42989.1 HD domain-containing protein [Clostridia bacterium]